VLGLCLVLGSAAAQSAQAFDLTGNWTGRWVCKGFDGTRFIDRNLTSTLAVTQSGNTVSVNMDNGGFIYNGYAAPDAKNPDTRGEVALISCTTDILPMAGAESEMLRGRVVVKPTIAVFKGTSVIEGPSDGVTGNFVGTCRYVFTRVDQNNPGVSGCGIGSQQSRR